jgi:hypothetical protein
LTLDRQRRTTCTGAGTAARQLQKNEGQREMGAAVSWCLNGIGHASLRERSFFCLNLRLICLKVGRYHRTARFPAANVMVCLTLLLARCLRPVAEEARLCFPARHCGRTPQAGTKPCLARDLKPCLAWDLRADGSSATGSFRLDARSFLPQSRRHPRHTVPIAASLTMKNARASITRPEAYSQPFVAMLSSRSLVTENST